MNTQAIDEAKFEELQGKVMGDVGGAIGLLMAYMGDQAGIYKVLEKTGPCTCEELAEKSGVNARYLRAIMTNTSHRQVFKNPHTFLPGTFKQSLGYIGGV